MNGAPEKQSYTGAVILFIVHALLLLILFAILVFIVPVFGAMFADFGVQLPVLTQAAFNLSGFCRNCGIFLVPLFPVVLGGDIGLYLLFRRGLGKVAGAVWLWLVTVSLVLLDAVIVLAMFIPASKITEAIGS